MLPVRGLTPAGPRPLDALQLRFSDGDVAAWAERVDELADAPGMRVGAAVHSVRAVSRDGLARVAGWARDRSAPLHVHLSEQPAENEDCMAAYRRTPTQVLHDAGVLGPRTTAVHAVHLSDDDVALLGGTRTSVCLCPTAERDLGDGCAPGAALRAAGSALCLGSDQHAVVDLFAEARAVEEHERLVRGIRGVLSPEMLVRALTSDGHRAIGWPEAGVLRPDAPADIVVVRTDTVRTAAVDAAQLVMTASAADVDTVIVGGHTVVRGGHHVRGDVGALLADAVGALWRAAS
ncbi:amidohydrolase family protein [Xylanimonas allomyrinae]|uniref:amidohydrolase family protein n=1 Tax=Xylanimonas allomyrinae TaxID=2509459 RepID=UPI0026A30D70